METVVAYREDNLQTVLTDKIKQLEGVIHMIAHNLRGPASNIKMFTDILKEKKIAETDQEDRKDLFTANEAIDFIQQSSTSLLGTLGSLMEITDIQLNENVKQEDCDIEELVQHVSQQLRGFICQKRADVELYLAVTHIPYPKPYMESILYNFINNALKYSSLERKPKIIISTYVENGRTVLTVKDNGIGIDLETFGSRMFKLNQVFHSGYESKGIGLYITKTQIETLGGSISVKSKVNEGSEFIVTF